MNKILKKSEKQEKNDYLTAFWLSIISSIFLFLSGTTGVSSWLKIEEVVLKYANFQIINILFIIILIVSSFGGILIFLAGIFYFYKKRFVGNLLILVGTGMGFIGFIFNFIVSLITHNFSFYSYLSFSSIGLIFAFIAQYFSNKQNIINWINKIKKIL